MDDDDGWQLLPKPPKRVKKTCFEKCIFCQMNNDVLRTAKPSSIEKVIFALELRQDEISQRLSPDDLRCTVGKKFCGTHRAMRPTPVSKTYDTVKRSLQVVLFNQNVDNDANRLIGQSPFSVRMRHGKGTEN